MEINFNTIVFMLASYSTGHLGNTASEGNDDNDGTCSGLGCWLNINDNKIIVHPTLLIHGN